LSAADILFFGIDFIAEAILEKDEETKRELEVATRRLEEEMARVRNLHAELEQARWHPRGRGGGLFGMIGRALDDIFDF
jgi:hypothetical protein